MSTQIQPDHFTNALYALLDETFDNVHGFYLDKGTSMFETLAQAMLIDAAPAKFFKPPYVGVRGWVGIELAEISTDELAHHLRTAWKLIAPKQAQVALTNK